MNSGGADDGRSHGLPSTSKGSLSYRPAFEATYVRYLAGGSTLGFSLPSFDSVLLDPVLVKPPPSLFFRRCCLRPALARRTPTPLLVKDQIALVAFGMISSSLHSSPF